MSPLILFYIVARGKQIKIYRIKKKIGTYTHGAYGANRLRHDGPNSQATFIDSGYVRSGTFSFLQRTY